MRSFLLPLLAGLLATEFLPAVTLQIDLNDATGVTLLGWEALSANDMALGDAFSRDDLPLPGGGTATIDVDPVGAAITLATRDRAGGASDPGPSAEYDMWRDFVFGSGSNLPDEGLDVVITGLLPTELYPVRIWSFDKASTGDRISTWNNVPYQFNGSTAGPVSLDDYVISLNILTDATGTLRIEGRANPPSGNTSPHHVFINGIEIGDPLLGPLDIQLAPARIHFAAAPDTVVGTLTSTHNVGGETFTYVLAAGTGDTDNARFEVEGDKVLLAGSVADVTVGTLLSIRVRSTDSNTLSLEKVLRITVVNDSDNDLLDDAWELAYFPTILAASGTDQSDDDELNNIGEEALGTNPTLADTDGDTLEDHVENNSRIYLSPQDTGSNPLSGDTDQDTLGDAEEVSGDTGYVTNPNRSDTDNDNFSDDTEIGRGTDPTSAASAPDVMELLVAYWPLDQVVNVGPLITPELKGTRDFTLNNMDASALTTGRFDQAMNFDGSDDILTRVSDPGDALPIAQHRNWTVSLWVRGVGTGQNDRRMFSEGSTTSTTPLLNLGTHVTGVDGGIDIYLRALVGPAAQHVVTSTKPLDGVDWHHLALVKNGDLGTVTLFIDGVAETVLIPFVDPWDPTLEFPMDTTTVGGILRAAASNFFAGSIDEVSLWRAHLSPAQIANLVNATGPLLTPPPPPEFAITGYTRDPANGEVLLSWGSEPGVNYSIEYSQSLTGWQSLPALIPSQGFSTFHLIEDGLPATGPVMLRVRRE